MNILFSDYDGTIKPFEDNASLYKRHVFNKNIKAIENFMKNGNKFVITTARNTSSISREVSKYNICFDYLTSYNGRVILDKDGKLIHSDCISVELFKEIREILEKVNINNVKLYGPLDYVDLEHIVIFKINGIDRIAISLLKKLLENYPDIKLKVNFDNDTIYISKNINKSHGIETLLNIESINVGKNNVYTVGDGFNDIDMLTHYNGYKMSNSHPDVDYSIENSTNTLYKLIKKIK